VGYGARRHFIGKEVCSLWEGFPASIVAARCRSHKEHGFNENHLPRKQVIARGAILSITKSIGSIPSFSPFEKGVQW
jgi:hypothetical protein